MQMEDQRNQEENAAAQWAHNHSLPYLDVRTVTDLKPVAGLLSPEDMETYRVVPLSVDENRVLVLGFPLTANQAKLMELQQGRLSSYQCRTFVISEASWRDTLALIGLAMLESAHLQIKDLVSVITGAKGDQGFRILCQQAYNLGASDIHIEPKAEEVHVRFRIDGALQPVMSLPKNNYELLLASIQTTSQMKWGSDQPQSGRLTVSLVASDQRKDLNIRLESIPTFHGEELIVRLLTIDAKFLDITNLGLSKHLHAKLDEVITKPHGLVLTVGPTGSGKTSMLYALINRINKPELKVVTLEDPVEYDLPGTSQIPVKSDDKDLFALKLRAVMRQDPNVVMIGEIRDLDTARTALQASLTGHLVLSTFHANSAAASLSRLMDMIGQNPLLASAVRMVSAQRLVRRLCSNCKNSYTADKDVASQIKQALNGLPAELNKPKISVTLYKSKGCDVCHGFGYRGRFPIVEQLIMTPEIQQLVASGKATATEIEASARKAGMVTLLQDGLLRVLAGDTTLDELYSVAAV